MRSLLQTFINAALSAGADAVLGAEWGHPTPDRAAEHNGYRHRSLDTRVDIVDVAVPKLRKGTYFPEWSSRAANEPRPRCSLWWPTATRMVTDLDEHVEQFRSAGSSTTSPTVCRTHCLNPRKECSATPLAGT